MGGFIASVLGLIAGILMGLVADYLLTQNETLRGIIPNRLARQILAVILSGVIGGLVGAISAGDPNKAEGGFGKMMAGLLFGLAGGYLSITKFELFSRFF
ncbi:MAG: hypothetical protein ACK4RK_21285 [Gemmataceae bacterium]